MLPILLLLACGPERLPDPGRGPVPGLTTGTVSGQPTVPVDPGATRAVHDRDYLDAAVTALGAASERVRVAEYLFYEGPGADALIDAIGDAADRGVPVQVLADETGGETVEVLARLELRDVQTRLDSRLVTLHNKLIVADDVVLVGSHNVTSSAIQANHEGSVLVRDAEVAGWYGAWFDAVWADSEVDPVMPELGRTDLVPIADRQVLGALLGCVDGAVSRVDLVLYALAWDAAYPGSEVDQLLSALEGAHGRGVAVDVVLDGSGWIVENSINDAAVARLEAAGIPVARTPGSITTHAKVLRCDETVVVSDANWSYSGLALAHGTSLVATEAAVVQGTVDWMASVRETAQ